MLDKSIATSPESLSSDEHLPRAAGIDKIVNSSDIIAPFYYDEGSTTTYGLGLVLNETLQMAGFSTPNSRFPFGRLAWLTSNTTSSLYIYHQVNESALAEEEHIPDAGWATRLITVPTG